MTLLKSSAFLLSGLLYVRGFLISSRDGGNFKKVCYGKGRMGSNYVWGLSIGTIVFLGIREAAKIMSRSLKLAPL